jgi:small subunit ribosomal protein S18
MAKVAPKRGKNKDNARRSKKKTSVLNTERIDYVDYKDVNLLRRFMSDRAKIRARRVTGNDSQQQKEIANAIKNAREMALLPYASRVTTQRGGGRDRGERGDRGDRGRADGPPPRPDSPPPAAGDEPAELIEVDAELTGGDDGVVEDVLVEAVAIEEGGE